VSLSLRFCRYIEILISTALTSGYALKFTPACENRGINISTTPPIYWRSLCRHAMALKTVQFDELRRGRHNSILLQIVETTTSI
jgi:hypothetical protein